MKASLLYIGLLGAAAINAAPVYLNTTNDTGQTIFYLDGPYTQIGDQITLVGSGLTANTASVQFFNVAGTSGTFDATLRFFAVGAPVGSQIGSAFIVTGNSIAFGNILNVNFSLGGLALPNNVVFTVSVANVTGGANLGLDLFDPPTLGSSSNAFLITNNGSTFAQTSTLTNVDNLYFSLDATSSAVPEPATIYLTLLGIPALALLRRVRRVIPSAKI